jgi:hypothetical protein
MTRVDLWDRLLTGEVGPKVLTDLGTSTLTGLRAPGAPGVDANGRVGQPVLRTVPLDGSACLSLGSDFVRAGLLFEPPQMEEDTFIDALGVRWLWADGAPTPLEHPLEEADLWSVARHPRPRWPDEVQVPESASDATRPLVVVDAPCAGLIDTCFALRGSWQFLLDVTDDWRIANALLDWSLETIVAAYEHLLTNLPIVPDLVLYGDDLGYQDGMFLSDRDFRTFVRPRMRTLLSRIRGLTPAPICMHSCGAIRTILPDLVDLGVEVLNLSYDARQMMLPEVRAQLPATMILHGYTDVRALGRALLDGDRRGIAVLATELAESLPAIAAPVDSLADTDELLAAARAVAFVQALEPDDIEQLRRLGPVRKVLERAYDRAAEAELSIPSPAAVGGATEVRAAISR